MNESAELINYRREKAASTLADAKLLLEAGSLSSAVNRIYYALFYEITALLLTKGLSSSKHSGIRTLFNEHFVRPGVVSSEAGRFFSSMFDFRQKSDYGDFAVFEEPKVRSWIGQTEAVLKEIETILSAD